MNLLLNPNWFLLRQVVLNPISYKGASASVVYDDIATGGGLVAGTGISSYVPFAPSSLSGLQMWLKADTGLFQDSGGTTPTTSNNDPVGKWTDQSGNNNHATQGTSGKRPVLKTNEQNGYGGICFDGVDDLLATPINASGVWTIAAVFKSATSTFNTYWGVFDGDSNTPTGYWGIFNNGTTNYFVPAPTYLERNGVSLSANYNLSPITSHMVVVYKTANASTALNRQVGSFAAFPGNGTIVEIAAYNSALSAANITRLTNYMRTKFSI